WPAFLLACSRARHRKPRRSAGGGVRGVIRRIAITTGTQATIRTPPGTIAATTTRLTITTRRATATPIRAIATRTCLATPATTTRLATRVTIPTATTRPTTTRQASTGRGDAGAGVGVDNVVGLPAVVQVYGDCRLAGGG